MNEPRRSLVSAARSKRATAHVRAALASLVPATALTVEGRVRVGYDLEPYVRLGVDGQVRGRAHGDRTLPGGRTWDFAAGPQVVVSVSHFFRSFTAGPVTLGVSERVGFSGMVTAGGTTL